MTNFRRYYNKEEYLCRDSDIHKTKREAQKLANYYRRHGYNARIAKSSFGYCVYHSTKYSEAHR